MYTMRKRVVLGFVCASLLFVFIFITNNELITKVATPFFGLGEDDDIACYVKPSTVRDDVDDFYSSTNKNFDDIDGARCIFFHETSCFGGSGGSGGSGSEGIVLTARQVCAVESAALMNPHTTIYLLVLSPAKFSNASKLIVEQLLSYENVRIRRIFMEDYVKKTPLEDWYASGILRASKWPKSHMSDILRYLTLWKFGGIYLDLDVVVTTRLEGLTNFAGAEDWEDVAAGVMGFGLDEFGRRLADASIRDLKTNFRGDVWGNNGPGVITRTLQKICATKYARDMTESRCHGFRVFPPSAFYPIHYKKWKLYFVKDDTTNETMKRIDKSRAIHVWNKLSSAERVTVGSQVPYAIVASRYCPRVYANCGKTF